MQLLLALGDEMQGHESPHADGTHYEQGEGAVDGPNASCEAAGQGRRGSGEGWEGQRQRRSMP